MGKNTQGTMYTIHTCSTDICEYRHHTTIILYMYTAVQGACKVSVSIVCTLHMHNTCIVRCIHIMFTEVHTIQVNAYEVYTHSTRTSYISHTVVYAQSNLQNRY